MEKSDEFVNLLETDRQKLKLALEKEKALNDGQVRQYEKLKRETSEEIDKLKKFSMLLVEEKQSGEFSNFTSCTEISEAPPSSKMVDFFIGTNLKTLISNETRRTA